MDGVTPPKLQRARGRIDLHLCGSKIERLYQSGSAKLMLPKTYGEMTEAVMLNTAGGITGGDLPFIFGSMRKGVGVPELADFLKTQGGLH